MTTYERPVPAKLIVRLDNGEDWEATDADLERFGYGKRLALYSRTSALLVEGLGLPEGTDLTRGDELETANLVRYVIECGIMYDHSPWADEHGQPWPADEDREDYRGRLRKLFGLKEET